MQSCISSMRVHLSLHHASVMRPFASTRSTLMVLPVSVLQAFAAAHTKSCSGVLRVVAHPVMRRASEPMSETMDH